MALSTVLLLAAVWGVVWALFLQYHPWGQWLAVRRTWLTVAGVIAASSLGIIVRSIANERREDVV